MIKINHEICSVKIAWRSTKKRWCKTFALPQIILESTTTEIIDSPSKGKWEHASMEFVLLKKAFFIQLLVATLNRNTFTQVSVMLIFNFYYIVLKKN